MNDDDWRREQERVARREEEDRRAREETSREPRPRSRADDVAAEMERELRQLDDALAGHGQTPLTAADQVHARSQRAALVAKISTHERMRSRPDALPEDPYGRTREEIDAETSRLRR